jgi:anti-sigma factor RsiW
MSAHDEDATMMHKPSLDLMQAALDGRLSPDEQARLDRELAASPEARARWWALVEAVQLLQAAPKAAPRPGFSRRFQERLRQRRSKTKMVWGALTLVLAAPVGMVVMAVLILVPLLILAASSPQGLSAPVAGIGFGLADARVLLEAVVTSAFILAGWAFSQPAAWLVLPLGGAVVAVWLYVVRKMTLEVSLS